MDVVAFALLGIGTLLVFLGIIFNFIDNRQVHENQQTQPKPAPVAEPRPSAIFNSPNYVSPANYYPPAPAMPNQAPTPPYEQPPAPAYNNEPASATFRMRENPRPQRPTAPSPVVDVMVAKENPKLFQKHSFLYLDQSRTNVYTSEGAVFSLEDVSGIKRVGEGIFSYDGFVFTFDTQNGSYRYPVANLNHIAFYPNCVVLVPRDEEYPALLFSDETDSIRRALETFKVES